jgi:ketosteroid isomerase-like protein
MSGNKLSALELTITFFESLENRDISLIEPHLADDVVEIIPLSNTGKPDPWFVFTGKSEVLDYLGTIARNFSQVRLVNQRHTVSEDGTSVFVQTEGDLIQAGTGTPYHNVYVFKVETRDGQIVHIDEYANPIAYALLAGLPIG